MKKLIALLIALLMILLILGQVRTFGAETYQVHVRIDTYQDSYSASIRSNPYGTYGPGVYTVFRKANGMLNITKTDGVPGAWINPSDNPEPASPAPSDPSLLEPSPVAPAPGSEFAHALAQNGLNLRTGPGTGYSIIGKIPYGTKVELLNAGSTWSRIRFSQKEGYVSSRYLGDAPGQPAGERYDTTARVNFRSGPGTGYLSYGVLPAGTSVAVTSNAGSWFKVEYNGTGGYIHSAYLVKTDPAASEPEIQTTPYRVRSRVNFREGPGTGYNSMGKLLTGTPVGLISASGSWSKILHNGVTGFVSSAYIEPETIRRPRIGITWFGSYRSYGKYVSAVESAGGEVVFLPQVTSLTQARGALKNIDGMVSIGGGDLSPRYYGEEASPLLERIDAARDTSDHWILKAALELDLPVVGICRGIQWINVLHGGTLYQDIPTQLGLKTSHRDPAGKVSVYHDVTVTGDSLLAQMIGAGTMEVDSWHHQGIKVTGQGLKVSARTADGLVEGIEATDKRFVVGVQFHPEKLYTSRNSKFLNVFKRLVEESR